MGNPEAGALKRSDDGEALGDRASLVGPRLREVRHRAGLSLRETAGRAEISPAFLSQIENQKSQPSVSTLYALCSVLETTVDGLFDLERTHGHVGRDGTRTAVAVVRQGDRAKLRLASGVTWERLATSGSAPVDCLFVTYEVGGASTQDTSRIRHGGTEYGLVLSGSLQIDLDFETVILEAGDSVSFDSTHPHRLSTVGESQAVAVWFVLDRGEPVGFAR